MRTYLVYDAEVSQSESRGMPMQPGLWKRDYGIHYLKIIMQNFPFPVVLVLTSLQDAPRYISVIKA